MLTQRQLRITTLFSLPPTPPPDHAAPPPTLPPLPPPGTITLITGPSGGGKSRLLNAILTNHPQILLASSLPFNAPSVIDLLAPLEVDQSLHLLADLGLAEATLALLPPHQLSIGQQHRLRFALALAHSPKNTIIAADEFAAGLDPLTAAIFAKNLARHIKRKNTHALLLATCQEHLAAPLSPTHQIHCNWNS